MYRRYKQLLPALPSPTAPPEPSQQGSSLPKRKRLYVKKACDSCRIKKTACDRRRPACTPCTRKNIACTFDGLPAEPDETKFNPAALDANSESASSSLIAALLTAHDAEAHNLLDRIRQGRSTLEVFGPWTIEEEELSRGHTILAPDQTSFEFELMSKYPVAYPALVPLDSHSEITSASDHFQIVGSHELEIYQDALAENRPLGNPNPGIPGHDSYEEKLRRINFARWTTVAVSGSHAASAIANYLAHDNTLLQLFDTDLFLKDIAHDYGEFCTSLLVNALLGWALPGIAITDDEIRDPAGAAYETALRQLEAQDGRPPCLSTLAAVELLSLTALFKGEGEKSSALLKDAIHLGKQLELFCSAHDPLYQANGPAVTTHEDRSRAIAAWGLYSLATMLSFHWQSNKLQSSLAPAYTFPVTETSSVSALVPRHMVRLWVLIHELNSHSYEEKDTVTVDYSASFARSMLARLLHWANELPTILSRGNRSTPEVMIMHVFFHAAIMAVTLPLTLRLNSSPLIDGENQERSAGVIYSASATQMHRLVDLYRFHSRLSAGSVFWHTALLFSANASIRSQGVALAIRRWRFLRAMDGYGDLLPRYPVMQIIHRGLMTMAVEVGLLTSQEAVKLARQLVDQGGRVGSTWEDLTNSCFVVDLELALMDRDMAVVDVLSRRFDEIVMFDDFTNENRGTRWKDDDDDDDDDENDQYDDEKEEL